MRYCVDPKNRAEIIRILTAKLKLKDAKEAEPHYQEIVDTYERKPYPSKEGLRNVMRFLALNNPKVGDINAENIAENSLVSELEARGFLK